MYGMIHQALRKMAISHIGEEDWDRLLRDAGMTRPLFIGMEYYSDATTMSLIHTVARHLDVPLDTALEEFGHVWIEFAGASEYGGILRMAGDDFVSFLDSLDRMHASIRSNMPLAEMPSFQLVSAQEDEMHLRYRSTRDGLAPLVKGILLAVAGRFGERVTVSASPEPGGALFIIRRDVAHG